MELVATQLGYVDPKTGTLVTSIRGLPGARKWNREENTFTPPLESKKAKEPAQAPAPEAKEPEVEKPKQTRGRKKKEG